jgi:hypothetical protein
MFDRRRGGVGVHRQVIGRPADPARNPAAFKETVMAKGAKAKKTKPTKPAATKAAPKKPKESQGDPIEELDPAQRRGTIEIDAYDTWIGMAVRADDLDALADAFEKAKGVVDVRRDVTAAALAGKLATPKSRYAVILKLKGHTWASIDVSWGDLWNQKVQQQLSRDAKQPVVTCAHQDTAGASALWLHDSGKPRIQFESTGAYEDDPSGTELTSAAHDADWWQEHANENDTIQALLRELDAYVPMFKAMDDGGRIALEAFPEDMLRANNVERVMLVVYSGKSDD